ncbi:MAG: GTPase ObgE [Thermoleophilia bacterium]
MFYDRATMEIRAGKGGNGCMSFRREKFVPKGGPDGGDGGHGGDIVLVATNRLRDLAYFQRQRHFRGENGRPGQGANKQGKSGSDAVIEVPRGTQVWTGAGSESGELLADLTGDGQRFIVARGGQGGRGNSKFVSSTRRTPRFAELGLEGEETLVRLELKLLADAGLLGFPNAGKSSLLRRVSHARPKVADYPFTTLAPMLGTVEEPDGHNQFTIADIPGLLEGASEGVGLGDEFLAHLERTRLLMHLVDVTGYYGQDPVDNFIAINRELEGFGAGLSHKWQLVALNKTDLADAALVDEVRGRLSREISRRCLKADPAFAWLVADADGVAGDVDPDSAVLRISAATGTGINLLVRKAYDLLGRAWQQEPLVLATEPEGHITYRPAADEHWEVTKEDDVYRVSGAMVENLVARTDFNNEEAVGYLQERLERLGVSDALRQAGSAPGDDVIIGAMEFEFW